MLDDVIWFDPPPGAGELPPRLASPFAGGEPHPLARRAADLLALRLARGVPGIDLGGLDAPGGGKMFGVLVGAAPDGRVGFLAAFSGMLDGRWRVDGFAPPLFDEAARAAFWPAGEAELDAIADELRALDAGDELRSVRARRMALDAVLDAEAAAVRARLVANRLRRRAARAQGDAGARGLIDGLAEESRADTRELRALDASHAEARLGLAAEARALDERRAALELRRTARSRELLARLHDGYVIQGLRGPRRALAELFAPHAAPGGAGDCAAPKLVAHAARLGLRPLALAERWWGATPDGGGRRAGAYYPACRGKCGPLLPVLLDGVPVDTAPLFGTAAIPADEPRVVFEDPWLLVVDKPAGLLSVPGRHAALRDSVLTRLIARHPDAALRIVHRLDLDASGLLLCAKDAATHAALQRQFARREVDKRYVAWLDGVLAGEQGTIELPLRGDLDDRPRQIVCAARGKPALTSWRVLAHTADRTKVELCPRSGRTHQLRVHAAHPRGLGAPIVGDRLYGRGEGRLLLHAEVLAFAHPETGERIELTSPAPF